MILSIKGPTSFSILQISLCAYSYNYRNSNETDKWQDTHNSIKPSNDQPTSL